jgi:hypothetical protein
MNPESKNTEAILQQAEQFMKLAGVQGVAIGERNGAACLLIFNSLPIENYADSIPATFEGLPVVYQSSSTIDALGLDA